jgi:Tol biopolymer transport system component
MRALAVLLVSIGVVGALGSTGTASASKPGCNGLLAFASAGVQTVKPGTYLISLDGRRTFLGDWGDVSPSPDGRLVAHSGPSGLVVAAANGSNPRPMLFPKGAGLGSVEVQWSPDSSRLAVTAVSGLEPDVEETVLVFDASTGAATLLGAGSNPRWSPDGSLVAFGAELANGANWVFVERPDGSDRRRLVPGQSVGPWSPDGRFLLVDGNVVPVDGGDSITIPGFYGLAWALGGSRIVGYGSSALESVASDGTDARVIAQDGVYHPGMLAPDGRRVVFDSGDHVVVTDLDGNVLNDFGPWDPGPYEDHRPFRPQWSPDGTRIAFWSGGKTVVADTETGTEQAVAGSSGEGTSDPVWSADSSSVYDGLYDTSGNTDIFVARADGTGVRPVFTDAVPEGGPVWSPDGKRLAFIRYGSRPSVVVTDLEGHARVVATLPPDGSLSKPPLPADGSLWPSPPAWSPDGKTLAVVSRTHVLLVNVRTGSDQLWTAQQHEAVAAAVTWSQHGITYTDGQEGSDIWTVGGGRMWTTCVCDFTDPGYGDVGGLATNLAWSPDGGKLAFVHFGVESGTDFLAWVVKGIQIVDRKTGKTRSIPTDAWGFAWSPDGRYLLLADGPYTEIRTATGKHVAWLHKLNPFDPSWQPLCRSRSGS